MKTRGPAGVGAALLLLLPACRPVSPAAGDGTAAAPSPAVRADPSSPTDSAAPGPGGPAGGRRAVSGRLGVGPPRRPGSLALARVPFEEVRALWVVRTTLTSPGSVRAMVEEASRGGFNTLLVQVRGRGDAYYDSRYEPRAEPLADAPPGFDPLRTVLEEAHARGMAVHAWMNTHVVTTLTELPSDPLHVARAAPELLAVPRELAVGFAGRDPADPSYARDLLAWSRRHRDRVEGLYTSPVRSEVHDHLVRVWVDVVEGYPVDGVHFDYVRYPASDFDYSAGALAAFRGWAGPRVGPAAAATLDAEARTDPLAWPEALPGLWDRFRRERLTALVARGALEIRRRRPEVLVSAAVLPDPDVALERHFQDWPGWAATGSVDVVAPMAYGPSDDRFRLRVERAVDLAGDPRRVWAGIGAYLTTFDGTLRQISLAREADAGGVVLFSYDWIAARGRGPDRRPFLESVGVEAFGRERQDD